MEFEHTSECETRFRPTECLQCWQALPAQAPEPKRIPEWVNRAQENSLQTKVMYHG